MNDFGIIWMKFGNEFWLILFWEYISPKLFAVWKGKTEHALWPNFRIVSALADRAKKKNDLNPLWFSVLPISDNAKFILNIFFRNRNIHLHKKETEIGGWERRPQEAREKSIMVQSCLLNLGQYPIFINSRKMSSGQFFLLQAYTFCPSDHSRRISNIQNLKKSLIHSWLVGEEVFASFPWQHLELVLLGNK